MSKPGQGRPDTQSYDRPLAADRAGGPKGADQPRPSPTVVMPAELGENSDADGAVVDPVAIAPAAQGALVITPPEKDPVVDKAPGAFRAGDVVDHFEIVGLIGQGGMGCVYKAFDRELGRTVAIKTLHGIDQQAPQALARFRREAQAASRVVHPNLVIIYSAGTFDGTPYIAMEYLSGRNLATEIAEGPMAIARTADILGAACAGVYAAHRAEVVHRDLKPANIFLAKTPMGETPKILDFGISRIGDDNSSLTGTGDVVGTTYYLSPEQAGGRPVDARVDQYALGVILYECLTGVRPFTGPAVFDIIRNIMEGIFEPPSHLRPEIPRELEAVVLRAMNRTPENRYARARDLGLALVPFMSMKGRQQWGHHFMAPEAEMPVGHSLAVPVSPGAPARPVVTPAQPPPTKVIPHAWQETPTRTLQAGDGEVSLVGLTMTKARPIRRRGGLVLAAIVVALPALALWLLSRPEARKAAPPAPPVIPAAKAIPRLIPPVVPEPESPQPTAMTSPPEIPSTDPTEARGRDGRDGRKKNVVKISKTREVDESAEEVETSAQSNTEDESGPQKTGMW